MKKISAPRRRQVAIFDIDGTIFRSSLLIEITEALVEEGLLSPEVKNIYAKAYEKWINRQGSYGKYIGAVVEAFESNIKGVDYNDFFKVAEKTIALRKNHVYRYTRRLVKQLKERGYYLLAISNSPKEMVEGFCKNFGFDKVYGRIYETGKDGKFTGRTLFADIVSDKSKILERAIAKENLTLDGSVGVGDSESDIPFLEKVEKPVCFNPNSKLYRQAKRAGWEVAVERKDVVYKINNKKIK